MLLIYAAIWVCSVLLHTRISGIIVMLVHDLLISVSIIVVAHVDAKGICRYRLYDTRSGHYKVEHNST